MGTAPSGWTTPKTTWQSADVVSPADLNRQEGNVNAIETGSRTIDPAQAPTGNSGTLRQLLDWFANRIRAITGTTNWYDAPPTTLAAAKSHIDAPAPHSGHAPASHTHLGSDITSAVASASNADTVDGYHASAFAAASHKHTGSDITSAVASASNADTVDGAHATAFAEYVGTVSNKRAGYAVYAP